WVLGQQDIITLDAHYDSTQLKQNKYTSLFFEEGWMLFNRCNRSFRIRLENLCRAGGVGAGVDVTCPEPQVPDPDPGSCGSPKSSEAARVPLQLLRENPYIS